MESDNIQIRDSATGDIEHLQMLEKSAGELFRGVPGLEWIADDATLSQSQHQHIIEAGLSFKALISTTRREDSVIAGFVCCELLPQKLHVLELSVGEQWQGRGIGRALMTHAINRARELRLSEVTLTTCREIPWNEPFYQKLGFETLDEDRLTTRLAGILDKEVELGFSRSQRCAMQLML